MDYADPEISHRLPDDAPRDIRRAYSEGAVAGTQGGLVDWNPYWLHDSLAVWEAWQQGFRHGQDERGETLRRADPWQRD